MPYIKKQFREKYIKSTDDLISILKKVPLDKVDGELNYIITRILKRVYINSDYEECYFNYNRMTGLLFSIWGDLNRRKIGPFEDKKRNENGDVE